MDREYWKERRRNLRSYKEDKEPKKLDKSYYTYYDRHKGKRWKTNREKAKERDNHRCVVCGITDKEHRENDSLFGEGLHVHHKKPVNKFEDPEEAHKLENLETICAEHHKERHSK